MKIVTVHNRYRSATPSGENRVVDREGEALAALGHEVVRFERSNDEIDNWSRAKKASLSAKLIWNREPYGALMRVLREQRPDVVQVHNTFPLLGPAVLYACRDAKVPVVASFHNKRLVCARGDFLRNGAPCHDCAHGSSAQAVLHGCYRDSRTATAPVVLATRLHRQAWKSLVSAYLFVSASLRDQLDVLAFPPSRVFVRYNLIPSLSRPEVTREPYIFFCGRVEQFKGVRLLMDSWDRYRAGQDGKGLDLVIAGSGPLDDEVASWAASRPSVHKVGHVDSGKLTDLMSRATAVVVPSIYEETFGLIAVEAMALGVPPIAAGHGGFVEIITPGVDGVLFRPGDPVELALAIADAAKDPARYTAYGEQARKTYEQRFDPADNLEQLLDIYRFAIAHPVWRDNVPGVLFKNSGGAQGYCPVSSLGSLRELSMWQPTGRRADAATPTRVAAW